MGDLSLETAAVPGWGWSFFFGGGIFGGIFLDMESWFFGFFSPIFQGHTVN